MAEDPKKDNSRFCKKCGTPKNDNNRKGFLFAGNCEGSHEIMASHKDNNFCGHCGKQIRTIDEAEKSNFCTECGSLEKVKKTDPQCLSMDHNRYASYGHNNCGECSKQLQ